jgi:hypothetical protein
MLCDRMVFDLLVRFGACLRLSEMMGATFSLFAITIDINQVLRCYSMKP